MSTNLRISAIIGLAILLVVLMGVSLFNSVTKRKRTEQMTIPPGHLVYKHKRGAIRLFNTSAKITVRTDKQKRTYDITAMTVMTTSKVKNGSAEFVYQRTISFPDHSDTPPEADMYRFTRSPYGMADHWTILSAKNPLAMGKGGTRIDPNLLMVDLENLPLIFPERALNTGEKWNVTGTTKFRHRQVMLDGAYDMRYTLTGTAQQDGKNCRTIEGQFTFDCPKQPIEKGSMSLHETGSAKIYFDADGGEVLLSSFVINRTVAGEWQGKPQTTSTTMKGTTKQLAGSDD